MIGAGISGLTAGKALADRGVPYTCFEASDDIGGNWYFGNPNGRSSAYRSLHIDTWRDSVSFRDMPMGPDAYPDYPHHEQVFAYINSYAEAFGLRDRIRFETAVERAERLPDGGWRIHLDGGESEEFDFLIVGNGHHWDPRFAEFPGSLRRREHSLPPLPLPDRACRSRRQARARRRDRQQRRRHRLRARAQGRCRARLPLDPQRRLGDAEVPLRAAARQDRQDLSVPAAKLQRLLARPLPYLASGRMEDYGLVKPNHNFLEAHPTVSSELLLRLGSGDATAKPNVSELLGDRVAFEDGTSEQIDAIVYATGYKITFPFLDPDLLSAPDNKLPLFKRIFSPGIDDLALIGFAQAVPTLFPFVELQAKLVARYASGDYALPSRPEMEAAIVRDRERQWGDVAERPRHTMQVDHYIYEHDLKRREIPQGTERARNAEGTSLRPTTSDSEPSIA